MKASEIREMSDEQLQLTINESSSELLKLRIQSQTERISTTNDKRKHRQTIARCKTIQRQRELSKVSKK